MTAGAGAFSPAFPPLLFARSPQPMWVYERRTLKFLDVNRAALKLYGYTRAEFLSLRLRELVHESDLAAFKKFTPRFGPGLLDVGVRRHVTKTGAVVVSHIHSQGLSYRGVPSQLSILSDVSKTVETSAWMDSLFHSSRDGIMTADGHGRVTKANPAYERLTGYSADEMLGMFFRKFTPREYIKATDEALSNLIQGAPSAFLQKEYLHKSGARIPVEVSAFPVREQSRILGYAAIVRDVSERLQLEQRYRDLYDRTPMMMHSIDREGRLVAVSDAWLKAMGYRREEVLGRRSVEFLTAASQKHAREVVLPAFYKTGVCEAVSYQMIKKSGRLLDVLLSATAERDATGAVVRSLAVLQDVTGRRKTQEELLTADAVFKSSFDGIAVTDGHGRFVRVNPAFARLTGYAKEELEGRSFKSLTPRQYHARGVEAIRQLRVGSSPISFEKEYLRKDGTRVPVHLTVFPVGDGERHIGSAAVVRDLTEQRRARQKLVAAEAWFESLFASSRDSIQSVSREGKILEFNSAFERLTGYTRKELLAMRFQDLTPPEFHHVDETAFRRLVNGEPSVEFEKEYNHKDGSRVPVRITAFTVRDAAARSLGYAAVIKDITAQRRLEKEIAETSAREQAKLGRDLHDSIGQTITAISLGAKTLRGMMSAPSEVQREAIRLESLSRLAIQQVRGLARALLPHELEAGDLEASLRSLSAGARQLFGVSCTVASRGDTQLSDKAAAVQLYRIAQEAVYNAARHARSRRGVRISLEAGARRLKLVVRDDGVGIPARRRPGAGLGIAIMTHRANSLGGSLVVRRAAGGGTEVVCECPRPKVPA